MRLRAGKLHKADGGNVIGWQLRAIIFENDGKNVRND